MLKSYSFMILIFDRFKGLKKREIYDRLKKQGETFSKDAVYEWFRVYKENDKKARTLTKDW